MVYFVIKRFVLHSNSWVFLSHSKNAFQFLPTAPASADAPQHAARDCQPPNHPVQIQCHNKHKFHAKYAKPPTQKPGFFDTKALSRDL
jgi:hypothetical protein